MPRRGYSNVAYPVYLVGTLDGSSTSNTISVSAEPGGTASAPPGWPAVYPYFAVIDPDTPSEEIVSVTAGSAGTLTITRGGALGAAAYGTATKTHQSGAKLIHVTTAADFDEANSHINTSTAVHGLAGGSAVVGTNDTQTLTNKTLANPTTLSGGGQVVGTTATQTLTNKTLTSPVIGGTGSIAGQSLNMYEGTFSLLHGGTVDATTVTATGAIAGSNIPSGMNLSSMATPVSTWTPTVTATTNPGLGTSPVREGFYSTLGRWVFIQIRIVMGTGTLSPGSGSYSIDLPAPAVAGGGVLPGVIWSAGSIVHRVPVIGVLSGSSITRVHIAETAGTVSSTTFTATSYGNQWSSSAPFSIGGTNPPYVMTNGDYIMFTGSYLRT